uniref:Uncharacterized protein n=1 Tax=Ascaris lumbricoides TaxID=6252 RepID=A0A0M3I3P1_ASCLU
MSSDDVLVEERCAMWIRHSTALSQLNAHHLLFMFTQAPRGVDAMIIDCIVDHQRRVHRIISTSTIVVRQRRTMLLKDNINIAAISIDPFICHTLLY